MYASSRYIKLNSKLDYALVYWVALFPLVNMIIYYATGKLFPIFFIPFLFILVILAIIQSALSNKVIHMPPYLILFGLFALYRTLWLFNFYIIGTYQSNWDFIFILIRDRFLKSFLLLLLMENIFLSDHELKKVIYLIIIIIGCGLFYSTLQIVYGYSFLNPFAAYKNLDVADFSIRSQSIFVWANAQELGMSVPMLLALILPFLEKRKFLRLFTIISSGIIIFLNMSRYMQLTFTVVLLTYPLTYKKHRARETIYNTFIILILLTSLIAVTSVTVLSKDSLINRLTSDSYRSRLLAVELFKKFIGENLIFGTGGVNTYDLVRELDGRSSHIHVGWLSIFYYYGLLGGLLYISSFILLIRDTYKLGKKNSYWGATIALLTFAIANMTGTSLYLDFIGFSILVLIKNFIIQHPQPETPTYINKEYA